MLKTYDGFQDSNSTNPSMGSLYAGPHVSAQVTGSPRQDTVPTGMSLDKARVWDLPLQAPQPLLQGTAPPALGTGIRAAPGRVGANGLQRAEISDTEARQT